MNPHILLVSVQKDLDVIGLKLLHYLLLENSVDSTLLFLPNLFKDSNALEDVASFVRWNNPNIIGISLMTVEYYEACNLTKCLKANFPTTPIVWGGVHPTLDPESCLQYADYVCIGEGEQTILDIARESANGSTDLRGVSNLAYKESGQTKCNSVYPLIDDLDKLAIYEHVPRRSFVQSATGIVPLTPEIFRRYARYWGTTYSVMSSRGCPFSCTYCCNNALSRVYGSRKVRRRSVAHLIKELEKAVNDNPFIEFINFQDDCFLAAGAEYLREFCALYRQKICKPFIVRSIPVFVSREKIEILKRAGIGWISLGLQSGSDRICQEIYKRQSLSSDFLRAARIVKDYNISAFYDIILDNPYETDEDRIETINTLLEIPRPFYTVFMSLTFYPGTELFERVSRECPDRLENPAEKHYFLYKKNLLNDITRAAAFLGKQQINRLVDSYRQNPDSLTLKLDLFVSKLESAVIFEPLTYLRLIHQSHREGCLKTAKLLSYYFREGINRFAVQFRSR